MGRSWLRTFIRIATPCGDANASDEGNCSKVESEFISSFVESPFCSGSWISWLTQVLLRTLTLQGNRKGECSEKALQGSPPGSYRQRLVQHPPTRGPTWHATGTIESRANSGQVDRS